MNNYKKGFSTPLAIAIVGILAIAGGVYLVSKNNKKTATNDTADWKKYTNTTYGFTAKYPADYTVVDHGPDPYELQLRAGQQISGTQPPLLTEIDFQDKNQKIVLTVDVADPRYTGVSADNKWNMRACGEEGFAAITSKEETSLGGYKTLHVVSSPDPDPKLPTEIIFYCVNVPSNPLIIHYSVYPGMMKAEAEAIIATLQFTTPTAKNETASWNSYTYSSIESGILPNMTFKYPSLFGNTPTLISSRNTNRPENIAEDWGGFFEFTPTGTFGDRGLRIEFFKGVNSENSFESYVSKVAASGGWGSPKYFQAGSYTAARVRFSSSSHYDADAGWYYIELSNKSILAISTSGDKKFLYDDDQNGNSTRDRIISTLVIGQ